MQDIRLVTLDLDGTVFTDDKRITARTLDAIRAAIARGVAVIPATGRPLSGLPREFLAIPGVEYALTSNGAAVWHLPTRKKLVDLPLSADATRRAIKAMQAFTCTLDVYLDGEVYADERSLANAEAFAPREMLAYIRATRRITPGLFDKIREEAWAAEKLALFFPTQELQRQAMDIAAALPDINPVTSVARNLELNAAGVDKGVGMLALAKHLGLAQSQTMACGDGGNDADMLRAAGLGVAMANAVPAALAAADCVTADNNSDGVALAIEQYVLG